MKGRGLLHRWRVLLVCLALVPLGCEKPDQRPTTALPPPSSDVFTLIREGDTVGFLDWLGATSSVDLRDDQGVTPLFAAIQHNRPAFAADLLERGADPQRTDSQGDSPLHRAARLDRREIIPLLLQAGADPTAVNTDGLSAYDLAMMNGKAASAALLAEARSVYLSLVKGEAPPPEPETESIPPTLLVSTEFRTWTSASGERIDAAFVQNIFDSVVLQNREGELFRIGLSRLSPADQQLVRQLAGLDPHALARSRSPAAATAVRPRDSIAKRVGQDRDWTVLEGCTLLKRSGNDGDSFHVRHDGKEYIFRLYFVDAAETSMSYPQRVKEQADYFDLDTDAALRLGEAAAKFTASVLAAGPFTVVTKWEDARGNSRLPRHYALVNTQLGDLDELLTREGLVRQYGMPVREGDGQRKQALLRKLENEAKQQKAGAWGEQSERRAAR